MSEVQGFRPPSSSPPTSLAEALRRMNFTEERAWNLDIDAKWGFCGGNDSPYEYDQGDALVVDYDDLYNLASVAIEAMKMAGITPPVDRDKDTDNVG